jgi:segregation and condensation protein A
VVSADYTVRLEQVFHGPMDLLLHLVREQEVEIHEVEIGLVIEGYLAYLQQLQDLDIELAGDFLVMSATLMALKTRSLLPQDELDLDEDLDPRDELIERLIEYRRFKEASGRLEKLASERERMHERGFKGELLASEEEPAFDLGELTVWDLWSTWSRLQRETAADRPHRILEEARPMRYFVEATVAAIKARPRLKLSEIIAAVDDGDTRGTVVGSFCALLELVRMGVLRVEQEHARADISIALADESIDLDAVVANTGFDDEARAEEDEDGSEASAEAAGPAGSPPAEDATGAVAPSGTALASGEPPTNGNAHPEAPQAGTNGHALPTE